MGNKKVCTISEEASNFVDKNLTKNLIKPLLRSALDVSDTPVDKKANIILGEISDFSENIAKKIIGDNREINNEKISELEDTIEGLDSDLFEAVQVAYSRGATDWAEANYPKWFRQLENEAALKKSSDMKL